MTLFQFSVASKMSSSNRIGRTSSSSSSSSSKILIAIKKVEFSVLLDDVHSTLSSVVL